MTTADIINITLATLTAITVYLTYRLMRIAANTNNTNKALLTEQFRLSNFPVFTFTTYTSNRDTFLKITNISNYAGYDLDIWLFLFVTDGDLTPETYYHKYVREDSKRFIDPSVMDFESWGVSDRGVYPVLTPKASIHIPLNYPPPQEWFFDVLIQYRDVLGNNYFQRLLFNTNHHDQQPYIAYQIEPPIPTLIERFDFVDEKIDTSKLPEGVGWLYQFQKRSFYSDQLITGFNSGPDSKWRIKHE